MQFFSGLDANGSPVYIEIQIGTKFKMRDPQTNKYQTYEIINLFDDKILAHNLELGYLTFLPMNNPDFILETIQPI
jgi:hypothetical protein